MEAQPCHPMASIWKADQQIEFGKGSLPVEETQAPVLHFCAANITLCDHFWGAATGRRCQYGP